MRNPEYQFVSADPEEIVSELISKYEAITGKTVHPASPERLFIQWVADVIVQERALTNYTGNQNIPSRAEGENLDALAELVFQQTRTGAKYAVCTMRFYITQAQTSAVLIPAGTRITDRNWILYWETTEDVYIAPGETYADVTARCQTVGTEGNGYAEGQINTPVDIPKYYASCENITASDGGANVMTDDELYEAMRLSMDAYSCAGATGSYIYFAKSVSTEIADVVANSPTPGVVKIYVLMNDGNPASEEIKAAVYDTCSADEVRPFTDFVSVEDPELVSYDIALTYYIPSKTSMSASALQTAVEVAVQKYIAWQCGKLGRDINPSYLIGLLMQTGIKRVDLTSPVFRSLEDGSGLLPPELAVLGTVTITNGGYEDE